MWKFWQLQSLVRSPADEGASGAGQSGGDDGASSEGQSAGGEGGEGQGESGGQSSILDFATGGDGGQEQDGEAWALPEGLEIPAHLVGTSAEDTLAKLGKAYHGARRELSQRGKAEGGLEGAVPDSPDGYTFEAEGENDTIAAELNSDASKPYVDAFRSAAHKLGIPDKAFSQLMRDGMAGIAETGVQLGLSNEEAQKISGEAEMQSLVSEVGQKEAGTIVNTIGSYAQKLAARGVLNGAEDQAEFAQMVGTARAARIFHRILTGEMGEKPVPVADGMDGTVTPNEAYAKHAAASRMPPGPEKDLAMEEAQKAMQKAFGTSGNGTGSVRSSVL